jgi:hypothetical protein
MNALLRLGSVIVVLAVCFGTLQVQEPGWTKGIGPALTSLAALKARVRQAATVGEQLDDKSAYITSRLQAKHQLAQDVVAERVTWREAAARLRDLDLRLPIDNQGYPREAYPSSSIDECYCRQIIALVQAEFSRPCDCAVLVEHLRAELDEEIECGGVCLP